MNKITMTTTLNKLKQAEACSDGYRKLRQHVGLDYPEDQPINLLTILDSNGVQDMLWCIRAIEQDWEQVRPTVCNMAADFAESVLHIFEKAHPDDDRPRRAIEAAGDAAWAAAGDAAWDAAEAASAAASAAAGDAARAAASAAAGDAARAAAWAAARAAASAAAGDAARAAAWAAAGAAEAAARAARAAAGAAAWAAAGDAGDAGDATWAAWDAGDATWAAWDAARAAELEKQADIIRKYLN